MTAQKRPYTRKPRFPVADVNNAAPATPAEEKVEKPAPRRRRSKLGEMALKLNAPTRPGFHRRWFNDDMNRLAQAGDLGYEFVSETGIETSSPDSRVSRLVGTKANGEPLRSYLMETPDELYAEGSAELEDRNRLVDDAIDSGRDVTGQMSPKDTYGQNHIQRGR